MQFKDIINAGWNKQSWSVQITLFALQIQIKTPFLQIIRPEFSIFYLLSIVYIQRLVSLEFLWIIDEVKNMGADRNEIFCIHRSHQI